MEKTLYESQNAEEVSVIRTTEMADLQQADYIETQQEPLEAAAELLRLRLLQINRIMWGVMVTLEILLGLRFFIRLFAVNPNSELAVFIYGITRTFTAPFNGLLSTLPLAGSSVEVGTLFGMAVYALLFMVLMNVIQIAADLPKPSKDHALDT